MNSRAIPVIPVLGSLAAAGFVMSGSEPYLLSERSLAVGAADTSLLTASSKDAAGRARLRGGKADLGAFAFAAGGSGALPY